MFSESLCVCADGFRLIKHRAIEKQLGFDDFFSVGFVISIQGYFEGTIYYDGMLD